jgi:hypothetical protein
MSELGGANDMRGHPKAVLDSISASKDSAYGFGLIEISILSGSLSLFTY